MSDNKGDDEKKEKVVKKKPKSSSTTKNKAEDENVKPRTKRKSPRRSSIVNKTTTTTEDSNVTTTGRVKRTTRRTTRGRKTAPAIGQDATSHKPPRSSRRMLANNNNTTTDPLAASTRSAGTLRSTRRASISTRTTTRTAVQVGQKMTKTKKSTTTKGTKTNRKSADKMDEETVVASPNSCCICKDAEATLGGMCLHKFCIPCFTKLVTKPKKTKKDVAVVDHHYTPTMGKCSKCKHRVSKFQMKLVKNGEVTDESAFEQHKRNVMETPLAKKVYCPKNGGIDPRFGFDEHLPYIDVKEAVDADMDNWVLNNGYPVPDRLFFEEEGCFVDDETRTFHGHVKWPVTFRGAHQWDVVLAFKKNYKTMDVGIIHERKERVVDQELLKDKTELEIVRLQYPFDGDWELTWKNAHGHEKIAKVSVKNNQFQRGKNLFNLDMSDPSKIFFRWPGDLETAEVTSGVDLVNNPMGPEIGEEVTWKTEHEDFPEGFAWERLTIGEMPTQETLIFGGEGNEYVALKSKDVLASSVSSNSAFGDYETASESDDGSTSDADDEFLRSIMRAPSMPFYNDFGIRASAVTIQDPLLRDFFS